MNIKESGTVCAIANKIQKIRGGNRMMVGDDVNLTMHFYRKDEPEKKCGTLKIGGNFSFSLFDAAVCLLAAVTVMRTVCAVKRMIRRF